MACPLSSHPLPGVQVNPTRHRGGPSLGLAHHTSLLLYCRLWQLLWLGNKLAWTSVAQNHHLSDSPFLWGRDFSRLVRVAGSSFTVSGTSARKLRAGGLLTTCLMVKTGCHVDPSRSLRGLSTSSSGRASFRLSHSMEAGFKGECPERERDRHRDSGRRRVSRWKPSHLS